MKIVTNVLIQSPIRAHRSFKCLLVNIKLYLARIQVVDYFVDYLKILKKFCCKI